MSGFGKASLMHRKLLLTGLLSALLVAPSATVWADVTSDSANHRIAGQPRVDGFGGDGGQAIDAVLDKPRDSEYGPDGSLYIVDTFNDRIRKIAPNGTITTVAGNGEHGYNGDEIPATEASLSWPHDLFVDNRGNLFIADSNNQRIRQVTTDGIIHTLVGTGEVGSSGDGGKGSDATIQYPKTVFRTGGAVYWSGFENRVRKLDWTEGGIVSTVAGSTEPGNTDGPSDEARFNRPQRMQIDSLNNIYLADTGNSAIRRIDAVTGEVTTVAGTGERGDGVEESDETSGPATSFAIDKPRGIAMEGDTVLFIADSQNHRIRRVDLVTGELTTIANGGKGYKGSGLASADARFFQPRGLTMSPEGDLIVADTFNSVMRQIDHTTLP